eukprot:767604-Hanusia_phi.AAC.2
MKSLLVVLLLLSHQTCCSLPSDVLLAQTSKLSPRRPQVLPSLRGASAAREAGNTGISSSEQAVEHVPLANAPVKTTEWLRGDVVGGYSAIIDVRSPSEFLEDHIPGAINLPVLDDEQRHEVGRSSMLWCFLLSPNGIHLAGKLHHDDHFAGRRLGASIISQNIATVRDRIIPVASGLGPVLVSNLLLLIPQPFLPTPPILTLNALSFTFVQIIQNYFMDKPKVRAASAQLGSRADCTRTGNPSSTAGEEDSVPTAWPTFLQWFAAFGCFARAEHRTDRIQSQRA